MALVNRDDATVSLDASTGMFAPQVAGLIAGQTIDAGAACYIKTADKKIWMSDGTAANEAAEFVGISARKATAGEPVTVVGLGARFRHYGSGLGPGDKYFVAATPGRFDTAATVGGLTAVVRAITDTDIVVISGGT